MKIFNFEFHVSEATRRDWRHVREASREFVEELWLPMTWVRLAVCTLVIVVLVLGSLFGGEGFGTGPDDQPQSTQRAQK